MGGIRRAHWDDLNFQHDNTGHIVATQKSLDLGVFFSSTDDVGEALSQQFTSDFHADRLVDFFRQAIKQRG